MNSPFSAVPVMSRNAMSLALPTCAGLEGEAWCSMTRGQQQKLIPSKLKTPHAWQALCCACCAQTLRLPPSVRTLVPALRGSAVM